MKNLENELFACHPVAHKIKRQNIQAAVATCSRVRPPQPARLHIYLLDHGVSNVALPLRGLRHLPPVRAHVAAYFLNAVVKVPVHKRLSGGVIAVQRDDALHVIEDGGAGDFDFAVPDELLQKMCVGRGGRAAPSVSAADFDDEGQVGRDEHIGVLGVVALLNEREFLAPSLLVHNPAQLSVHDRPRDGQNDGVNAVDGGDAGVFEGVKSGCCIHMVDPNSNRPEQNEVGNERANGALNSARDWLARGVQSADDFALGIRRARDVHISAQPVRLCEHHFAAANASHSAWSTSIASPLASLQPENTLYQLGGCAVDLPLTMTRILLTIAIVLQSLEISAWALVGGTATGHFTSRFGQLPSCSSVRLRVASRRPGASGVQVE